MRPMVCHRPSPPYQVVHSLLCHPDNIILYQFQILKRYISIRVSHQKEVKMVPQPLQSPVHTSQSKTLDHQTITKHKVSDEPHYDRQAYNQSRHRSQVAQKDRESDIMAVVKRPRMSILVLISMLVSNSIL